MIANTVVMSALAAGLMVAAPAAFAASGAASFGHARAQAAFADARITLAQAIAAAEKQTNGGKVLDIAFRREHGVPAYYARVLKDGAVNHLSIDPATGNVTGLDVSGTPENHLGWRLRHEVDALQAAKADLAQAVGTAETQSGGKAMSAMLIERRHEPVYDIRVMKDGRRETVMFGAVTGQPAASTHRS